MFISQGDEADGMYFVESGCVNITLTESDATEREVSVCKAGSYLGKWLYWFPKRKTSLTKSLIFWAVKDKIEQG